MTLDSPDELGDLARALNRMAGDLRSHEEALRAERADLAAKNAEVERFAYTVSHDLKTRLVTIRGFAGLAGSDLAAGKVDRVRQDLGRIVAAADKMHRLLDDILELSRVGRVVDPSEDVPLGELARETVELVRGQLAPRGIAVDIAPGLPVVRADRRRLLEVLQNLLENAAKFADGQAEPRVEIGMRVSWGEGELVPLPGQYQLPGEVQQEIADLLPHRGGVDPAEGLVEFHRLLDQIGAKRGPGLDPVPWAPFPQVGHHRHGASKR